jgi:hypothetical protein
MELDTTARQEFILQEKAKYLHNRIYFKYKKTRYIARDYKIGKKPCKLNI